MAKKQLTPAQYKEKLEKKAEKRKKFITLFVKTVAICVAIAITYSAIVVANTRIGLSTIAKKTTVTVGGDVDTNTGSNSSGGFDSNTNNGFDSNSNFGSSDNTGTDTNNGTDVNNGSSSATPDNSSQNKPNQDNNSSQNKPNQNNSNQNNSNQNKPNQNKPNQDNSTQNNQGNTDVMSSKKAQFDLFVNAFTGVKTNAKSVTQVKKNAYNYKQHVDAKGNSIIEAAGKGLMGSLLKPEETNITYTGADIDNFPPSGTTCGLTQADVQSIVCKEDGDYYIITVVVKGAVNPVAGKQVGAVASILTKESIQEPIKDVPIINSLEPKCDYKATTAEATIEKSTGKLVGYYFDLPMILFMGDYSVGLGFEEWWTVAY